jgi:hypothetical protein
MIRTSIVWVTLTATAVLLIMGSQPASAATQLYGAHRGEGWPSPHTQDSSLAIAQAIADPEAWFVESDVWRTAKDGLGLMQHDNDLSVASDCAGLISTRKRADILAHCRMDDGSVPQTVEQYVHVTTSAQKHAILHVKTYSSTFYTYLKGVLRAEPNARAYVRVMLPSPATVKAMLTMLPDWYFEYVVSGPASASTVSATRALGSHVRVMLAPASLTGAMPSSWITPWRGVMPLDMCTYNHDQDVQSHASYFQRVLTRNIPATKAAA